ncbi:unnamed protein product [Musa acuminata subsp. malaccensis]|uniref:(wild Malaysian banana) hypothetical protein n=1 Tax=Musa acuminata subsp. malaccensis TaxID=214687 RepID=A0A804KAH7_MUSAM|nr:unnamed protein product [Musa acuminata subsp. malaccensis]
MTLFCVEQHILYNMNPKVHLELFLFCCISRTCSSIEKTLQKFGDYKRLFFLYIMRIWLQSGSFML